MQTEVKTNLLSNAFKLYLVGGVAIVLAILWWLVPGSPAAPTAMGRLEQTYREEISVLFGETAATGCHYWPKHLYISCGTVDVNASLLHDRGWKSGTSSGDVKWYVRDQWKLKLRCAPLSARSCAVEIWFVGG
jgi:hypothetical protein